MRAGDRRAACENIVVAAMTGPLITFLSDYGLEDEFAGVCHAVIAGICPDARVIDLTHGIPRHDVRAGALVLRSALPYLPPGSTSRSSIPTSGPSGAPSRSERADDRRLVGPDNGLLSLAAQAAGGVVEAVDIARSPFRLEPVSATFHGRDIFAPVAARLAAGAGLAEAGEPIDPGELVSLELPRPRVEDGSVIARAVYIDRFGNVQLGVEHEELADTGLKLAARSSSSSARGPSTRRTSR